MDKSFETLGSSDRDVSAGYNHALTAKAAGMSRRPTEGFVLSSDSQNKGWRHLMFGLCLCTLVAALHTPLAALLHLSLAKGHGSDAYSHIVLIPIVSALFLVLGRNTIFATTNYSWSPGAIVVATGVTALVVVRSRQTQFISNHYLSITMSSLVVVIIGIFVIIYGMKAFRAAIFPLLFLGLTIPLPRNILAHVESGLQSATSYAAYCLLNTAGMPVVREGLILSLPGFDVWIARECSGIRSSLALFITVLIAGHLFLQSRSRKMIMGLAAIPVAIIDNAVRIAALSWLTVYVDKRFLSGDLHRDGGIVFFLLGCTVLTALLLLLMFEERKGATPAHRRISESVPVATVASDCDSRRSVISNPTSEHRV